MKARLYNWGRAATHGSPLTLPLQDLNIHETLNAFISSVIMAGLGEKKQRAERQRRNEREAITLFKQESGQVSARPDWLFLM